MIKGNLAGGSIPKNLSFGSIIDTVRRKKLMDALMSTEPIKKSEGMKVLQVGKNIILLKNKKINSKNYEIISRQFLKISYIRLSSAKRSFSANSSIKTNPNLETLRRYTQSFSFPQPFLSFPFFPKLNPNQY
jgi:hypothetical protein